MIGRHFKKISPVRYRFCFWCVPNPIGSVLDHGNLVGTGHSSSTGCCNYIPFPMVEKQAQLVMEAADET